MKKVLYILIITLLTVEVVLASEDINLNVDMPKKVVVGENFKIKIYVNLNRSISGFECKINIPIYGTENIQFINATGNEKIKEKAGKFYQLDLTNNSVFISFALFTEPLNSNFYLVTVEGKALKKGVVPIEFDVKASDENGRTIGLSPITYNLEIVDGNNQNNDYEKKENENIFIMIIKAILNFFKVIFGI